MKRNFKKQENGQSGSENNASEEVAAEAEDTVNEEQQEQESADTIDQEALTNVASVNQGDIVKGKVVKVEDNQVLVDIGYKYDGLIPIRELSALHLEKHRTLSKSTMNRMQSDQHRRRKREADLVQARCR